MAKNDDYMNFPQPALRIVKTVGGYFRVYIQGKDDLQDNLAYAVMDIGRGPTKDSALAQARTWFEMMEDNT